MQPVRAWCVGTRYGLPCHPLGSGGGRAHALRPSLWLPSSGRAPGLSRRPKGVFSLSLTILSLFPPATKSSRMCSSVFGRLPLIKNKDRQPPEVVKERETTLDVHRQPSVDTIDRRLTPGDFSPLKNRPVLLGPVPAWSHSRRRCAPPCARCALAASRARYDARARAE